MKSINISLCKNSFYFSIRTYFFYFTYQLFKTPCIRLSILHHISLNYQFSWFFNCLCLFTPNNHYPLSSFILGKCKERIKKWIMIVWIYIVTVATMYFYTTLYGLYRWRLDFFFFFWETLKQVKVWLNSLKCGIFLLYRHWCKCLRKVYLQFKIMKEVNVI